MQRQALTCQRFYHWGRDIREVFENLVLLCKSYLTNYPSNFQVELEFAFLEVIASLINFYNDQEYKCNPDTYEKFNEVGYLKTPLSRETRLILYGMRIEYVENNKWVFNINNFTKEQWTAHKEMLFFFRLEADRGVLPSPGENSQV